MLSLPEDAVEPDGVAIADAGVPFLVVPLRTAADVARVRFDTATWRRHLAGTRKQNVYVTAPAGDGQYRVRMFAPGVGIDEDPATGAAATAFAGYLARDVGDGTHRRVLTQGVEMGRPSRLEVAVDVAGAAVTAVRVGGGAVRVSDGTMRVPG